MQAETNKLFTMRILHVSPCLNHAPLVYEIDAIDFYAIDFYTFALAANNGIVLFADLRNIKFRG